MKYLDALLKGEEIPRHTREEEPLKPLKPVSEVLEGSQGRSTGEIGESPAPLPWPCPHCGRPAEIEAVEPSLDGQRVLTYWHCERCQVWAVTPSTLREPPAWVSRREQ